MFLDDITKKYPEIEQMTDEIIIQKESVIRLIYEIINMFDKQYIERLNSENKSLIAYMEEMRKKYEYPELRFPKGLQSDSKDTLSVSHSESQINMPDSQIYESQIFQSQTILSDTQLFREERNLKMFDSQFEYDIHATEKKIMISLNNELFNKLGHTHENISDQSGPNENYLHNRVNNIDSYSILEQPQMYSSVSHSQLDVASRTGMDQSAISYEKDDQSNIPYRTTVNQTNTFENIQNSPDSFKRDVKSIKISSKLDINTLSQSDSSTDQVNFLELNQRLYNLKQENMRLSRELNYVLSSGKKSNTGLYIKNYYEIVDLLRDKLEENVRLKNNSFLMSMKLQNIEKCMVSFIKNNIIQIIRETMSVYNRNLVFFFTENQKLVIQSSNLKMIEKEYQNAQNEIILCKQIKKDNERLEKELKTLSLKNVLINSLEKRIGSKSSDITVLEARNKILSDEITRLLGILTEKERIISNMVIETPIKNRILELEELKKDTEKNKIEQKRTDNYKSDVLRQLKLFYKDLKSKIIEEMMAIENIILFYKGKKDNQIELLEKKYKRDISSIKEEMQQLSVLLDSHRKRASQKDTQVSNLINELQSLKTENTGLSNKIEKINEENKFLITQNKTLTDKLDKLKKEELSPDLHSLIELERRELEEQLHFYKNKYEEHESDQYIDSRTIKEQNDKLSKENANLISQNKDLREHNSKLESFSQEISKDHQTIQTNYSTLIPKYKSLDSQYNSLRAETKEKLKQLAEIQTLQDDTETQLDLARQKYSDLFEKYEQTSNELDKMTDQYENLKKQGSDKRGSDQDRNSTSLLQDQEKKIENLKSVIIKLKAVNQKLVDHVKLQGSS